MNKRGYPILTKGSVAHHLVRLMMPMMLGMFSLAIFQITDTFFIGKLGKNELAAISFTFPIIMVVNGIALGLGTGVSSVISRTVGAGNINQVRRLTVDALLLGILIVSVVLVVGELTISPLFRFLGAADSILPLIENYMSIWYIGVVFVVIPMIGSNIIRATGDTATPGLIMTASAILNMLLDPLFIFGLGPFPQMGIAGGAVATVIARALNMVFSLHIIIFREKLITFERIQFREVFTSWQNILVVGIPASLSNFIVPVTAGIITRMIAGFGISAVAGFGVGNRLQMLLMLVIKALASIMIPFTGQNWGAGLKNRVRTALKTSYVIATLWSMILLVLIFIIGKPIVALFNKDSVVIETAVLYLRIVVLSYSFRGMLYISSSSLNALNKPIFSISFSLINSVGLYIPLSLIWVSLWGLRGIFIASFAANTIAGILAAIITLRQIR
jgi:putative MATE family efflux protein